jgi:hypothetical protein
MEALPTVLTAKSRPRRPVLQPILQHASVVAGGQELLQNV